MALYFLYMKTFGRGNGSSAINAIAYRAGERIRDERTGRVFDHSDRQDVLHKEIVLPARWSDADMGWAMDRATLWNTVEAAETRRNARVAREFLVALPAELAAPQQVELTRSLSRELVERHRFAIDFAIHAPRTDPRNFHAHLLATTREIHSSGFGEKTDLEIGDGARLRQGLEPFYWEVAQLRERWATLSNAALARANVTARVDHRSLEAQGVAREPQPMLPRAIIEMERRGQYTELGERIRAEFRERVAARAAHAAPAAAESLEEIRRKAREEWMQMRRGKVADVRSSPPAERFFDDDLSQ
jgi:ATP-dependent exoDNAse (exonuclease V) alpha subunit